MTRILAAVVALACACSGRQAPEPGGEGSGSAPGSAAAAGCDALRPKLEQLYRAEAEAREARRSPDKADPAAAERRIAEAVADNTTMVLNDCAKAPDRVIACVGAASSIAHVEQRCLEPLDDEGREGEALGRR